MNPIFRLIIWVLQNHGTFVSGLFVYVAVPLIAWCFGRRSGRKKTKASHTFVLVIRPPAPMSSGVPPVNAGISSRRMTPAARLATLEKGTRVGDLSEVLSRTVSYTRQINSPRRQILAWPRLGLFCQGLALHYPFCRS